VTGVQTCALPIYDNGVSNAHAFFWNGSGPIVEIKPLSQHKKSAAFGMNNHGQVVGQSYSGSPSRAFLWQNGTTIDINGLIPSGSSLYLFYANDINDAGEITGGAVDLNTGELVAFLAIPPQDGADAAIAAAHQTGNASPEIRLRPDVLERMEKHGPGPVLTAKPQR